MGAEMVRERKVNLGVTSASFGSLLGQRILALTDIFDNLGGGLVPFGNPFGKHSFDERGEVRFVGGNGRRGVLGGAKRRIDVVDKSPKYPGVLEKYTE